MSKGTMVVRPRHSKLSTYVRARAGDKPGGRGSRTMLSTKPKRKVKAKKRSRQAFSNTKTTTTQVKKKISNLNAGQESSSFTTYIKKLAKSNKPWKSLSNKQIMHQTAFNTMTCSEGTQNLGLLGISMQGNGGDQTIAGLLRDQSLLLSTATDLFGTGSTGSAGYRQVRLLYEGMKQNFKFVNQAVGATDLWIYDVVSKVTKGSYSSPATDWALGYTDTNVQPAAAISTYAGGDTTIGAIPTESKVFNINWKVVGRTTVRLGPGAEHNHQFNMRPNKVIDGTYAANFAQIRGVTCGVLVVQRGPLTDSTLDFIAGNPTYGKSKVIIGIDINIHSRIVGQYPAHTTWTGTQPPTANTNEYVVDPAISFLNQNLAATVVGGQGV